MEVGFVKASYKTTKSFETHLNWKTNLSRHTTSRCSSDGGEHVVIEFYANGGIAAPGDKAFY